ncbi:MAG: hypothetical protein WAK57_17985 [Desulfobacterales bacterium]
MRFTIETFFSDQKSRGFNIDKSHLSCPQRLTRLMYASCLAYFKGLASALRPPVARSSWRL